MVIAEPVATARPVLPAQELSWQGTGNWSRDVERELENISFLKEKFPEMQDPQSRAAVLKPAPESSLNYLTLTLMCPGGNNQAIVISSNKELYGEVEIASQTGAYNYYASITNPAGESDLAEVYVHLREQAPGEMSDDIYILDPFHIGEMVSGLELAADPERGGKEYIVGIWEREPFEMPGLLSEFYPEGIDDALNYLDCNFRETMELVQSLREALEVPPTDPDTGMQCALPTLAERYHCAGDSLAAEREQEIVWKDDSNWSDGRSASMPNLPLPPGTPILQGMTCTQWEALNMASFPYDAFQYAYSPYNWHLSEQVDQIADAWTSGTAESIWGSDPQRDNLLENSSFMELCGALMESKN